ncbi:MAG: lyase family protein [Pseudomonadota bacterium]
MVASLFDSPAHALLFPTGAAGRLFSDTATVRALLLVEAALAKAQGALEIIPETSAAAIQRAAREVQIDASALRDSIGRNGVIIPGLLEAFRIEMQAPEHAQYLHWGATSQDILDTALMLRLRQALALAKEDLRTLLRALAAQAEEHAALPMMARTYGQHAVPTTWGAVIGGWGQPLADKLAELETVCADSLWVSLSGAAGTASALGAQAPQLRKAMAEDLGLQDPGRSWHGDRTPVLRIADWLSSLCVPFAAMAETLISLTGSDISEVSIGPVGGSSTMPQKQNPVQPAALLALCRHCQNLRAGLAPTAAPMHQRDGAAWFGEWLTLPIVVLSAMSALQTAVALANGLAPRPERMLEPLKTGLGLYHAEALSFALVEPMTRPEAQAECKELCAQAVATQTPLPDLARTAHPGLPSDLFGFEQHLGEAPAEARSFAVRVREMV